MQPKYFTTCYSSTDTTNIEFRDKEEESKKGHTSFLVRKQSNLLPNLSTSRQMLIEHIKTKKKKKQIQGRQTQDLNNMKFP